MRNFNRIGGSVVPRGGERLLGNATFRPFGQIAGVVLGVVFLGALGCGGSTGDSEVTDPNQVPTGGMLRLALGHFSDLPTSGETDNSMEVALQFEPGERYLLALISEDLREKGTHQFTGRNYAGPKGQRNENHGEPPSVSKCVSLSRLTSVLSRPARGALGRWRLRKAEPKLGDRHEFLIDEEDGQAPHKI